MPAANIHKPLRETLLYLLYLTVVVFVTGCVSMEHDRRMRLLTEAYERGDLSRDDYMKLSREVASEQRLDIDK